MGRAVGWEVKCISLWQPWASLIAIGAKRVETRSWETKYRGPLAIHAASSWTRYMREKCFEPEFLRALRINQGGEDDAMIERITAARGHIVATCRLAAIFPTPEEPKLPNVAFTLRAKSGETHEVSKIERAFGNYLPGRFAWVLEDIKPLARPVRLKGKQRLFEVPDELFVEVA